MRIAGTVVWIALALAACKRGDSPGAAYPQLDPEPTGAAPTPIPKALADELVPLPQTDPAYDPALGKPPVSSPRGAPIAITIRTPQVGDVRTRELRMRNVIDFGFEASKHRQLSSNHYDFREELWKLDGANRVYKVHVNHATEAVLLKDKPHSATTATGDYLVAVFPAAAKHAAGVTREDGSELGGREVEELADLFGFDSMRPHPLVEIVSKRPLRVGESVELTEAENTLFGGGLKVESPVFMTLLDATPTVARYQADVLLHFPQAGSHERRLRYVVSVERATGRLVELHELMHDRESDDKSRQEHVQHLTMRLGYPAR